jgi:Ran GTPase-activating protein (RanGAP) involved in mRNA processing and transport
MGIITKIISYAKIDAPENRVVAIKDRLDEFLRQNQLATYFDFSNDIIGNSGMIDLAKILGTNQSICDIDLWNNDLGDEGAEAIIDLLTTNQSIININSKGNNISVGQQERINSLINKNLILKAIKNRATTINLSQKHVSSQEMQIIASALKDINFVTEIDLSASGFDDESAKIIIRLLETNRFITSIDCLDTTISDDLKRKINILTARNKILHLAEITDLNDPKVLEVIATLERINFSDLSDDELHDEEVLILARNLGLLKQNIAANDLSHQDDQTQLHEEEIETSKKDHQEAELLTTRSKLGTRSILSSRSALTPRSVASSRISRATRGDNQNNRRYFDASKPVSRHQSPSEIFGNEDDQGKNLYYSNQLVEIFSLIITDLHEQDFTGIIIHNCNIRDRELKTLADTIKISKSINKVDFSRNQIQDDGVIYLAEALRSNRSIASINLSNNKITSKSAAAIIKLLRDNIFITSINIASNDISKGLQRRILSLTERNKILKAINNNQAIISLDSKDLGSEELDMIIEALDNNRSVTTVNLGNHIEDDLKNKIIAIIARNRALKAIRENASSLDLSNKNIGIKELTIIIDALSENTSVQKINLANNNIGDAGVKYLAEALKANKLITDINLWNNQITDQGAEIIIKLLMENQFINSINVGNNKINRSLELKIGNLAEINQILIKSESEETINLSNRNIGSEELDVIIRLLKVNKTIKAIDLATNNIADPEAAAIIQFLKTTNSTTQIILSHNKISHELQNKIIAMTARNLGLEAIAKGHLVLDLRGKRIGIEELAVILQGLGNKNNVTEIDLAENNITDQGAEAIIHFLNITNANINIKLENNPISDHLQSKITTLMARNLALKTIADEPANFDFVDKNFEPKDIAIIIAAMAKNYSITGVNLTNISLSDKLQNEIGEIIQRNQIIRLINDSQNRLDLRGKHFGDQKLQKIIKGLRDKSCKSITEVDLAENDLIKEGVIALFEFLATNKQVNKINLENNKINVLAIEALTRFLKTTDAITDINLNNNNLEEKAVAIAIDLLKISKSITYFNLSGNNIADKEAVLLAENIKIHNLIANIVISNNKITDYGALAIIRSLTLSKSFTSVDLSNNNLTDVTAVTIVEILQNNQSITNIKLDGNQISANLLNRIAALTARNSILKANQMHCSNISSIGTYISDQEMKIIADNIRSNKSAKYINFTNNNISDSGAKFLFDVIKDSSITAINLENNSLTDNSLPGLIEVLENNKLVTDVNLLKNQITDIGANLIINLLKSNYSLINVKLGDNIDQKLQNKITALTARNQALKAIAGDISILNLTGKNITTEELSVIIEALSANNNVTKINLANNNIDDHGLEQIIQLLNSKLDNPVIIEIDLENNDITDEGANKVIKFLKETKSTVRINIKNSKINIELQNKITALTARNQALKAIAGDISILNLSNQNIAAEELEIIIEALSNNNSVIEVILDNSLKEDKLKRRIIALTARNQALKAIRDNQTILDLSGKNIEAEELRVVIQALEKSSMITDINLGNNNIGDEGVAALVGFLKYNSSINSLNLNNSHITNNGADSLIEILQNNKLITEINIKGNGFNRQKEEEIAAIIGRNLALRKIANNPQNLDLKDQKLGIGNLMAVFKALKTNSMIANIDLENCDIDDQAAKSLIKVLKTNKIITNINLEGNNISASLKDKIFALLTRNRILKEIRNGEQILDMTNKYLGAEELRVIFEVLRTNESVTIINLGNNNITDDLIAEISESLKTNQSVININLQNNIISEKGLESLIKLAMSNKLIENINLENNNIGDAGAKIIINLLENNQLTAEINLEDNDISEELQNRIIALKTRDKALEAINNDEAILDLSDKHLDIKELRVIFNGLKSNSSVKTIYLGNNQIGDEAIELLAELMAVNQSIVNIDLGNNNISHKGIATLAESIKNSNSLANINLEGNKIDDQSVLLLSESLLQNKSIITLNLGNNNIGLDGAEAIKEVLAVNQYITNLDLSDNHLGDQGVKLITEPLLTNKSITNINLENNNIGVDGAEALADVIEYNNTVRILNLKGNNIGDEGARNIAGAVEYSNHVTEINLAGNFIGDNGAKAFAEALEVSKSVSVINLDGNNIGDIGMAALGKTLNNNHVVANIGLAFNNIGPEGARVISDLISSNNFITEIDLGGNNIGNEGAEIILNSIKENYNIVEINVGYNNIYSQLKSEIDSIIARNQNIQKKFIDYAVTGNLEKLQKLYKSNPKLNFRLRSPSHQEELLKAAIKNNKAKIVEFLLKEGLVANDDLLIYARQKLVLNRQMQARKQIIDDAEKIITLIENNKISPLVTSRQSKKIDSLIVNSVRIKAVTDAIDDNKPIIVIDLSNLVAAANTTFSSNLSKIAKFLKTTDSVDRINFAGSYLQDSGVEIFSKALKFNHSVTSLSLVRNNIGAKGINSLADNMESNYNITAIEIDGNSFATKSAPVAKLDQFIKRNQEIQQKFIDHATNGKLEQLQFLYQSNPNINFNLRSKYHQKEILKAAIKNCHIEIVRFFVKQGFIIDSDLIEFAKSQHDLIRQKGRNHKAELRLMKTIIRVIQDQDKELSLPQLQPTQINQIAVNDNQQINIAMTPTSQDTDLTITRLLKEIAIYDPKFFLSYAWSNDDSVVEMVDKIDHLLLREHLNVYRDKRGMYSLKVAVREFMKHAQSSIVISFINDAYLKSDNCMYEVRQALKFPDYARIFPIIYKSDRGSNNDSFENQVSNLINLFKSLEARADISPKDKQEIESRLRKEFKLDDLKLSATHQLLNLKQDQEFMSYIKRAGGIETILEGMANEKFDPLSVYKSKKIGRDIFNIENLFNYISYWKQRHESLLQKLETLDKDSDEWQVMQKEVKKIEKNRKAIALFTDLVRTEIGISAKSINTEDSIRLLTAIAQYLRLKDCRDSQEQANIYLKPILETAKSTGIIASKEAIGIQGAIRIAEFLAEESCQITTLNLSCNNITDEGLRLITRAILKANNLVNIDLSDNQLEEFGAKKIAKILIDNKSIKTINLNNNHIKDGGIKFIAESLRRDNIVIIIGLANNQIEDDGVKAIAKMLENNFKITNIDLSNNSITDKGADSLIAMLKINKSITKINLSNNRDISHKKIEEIEKLLTKKVPTTTSSPKAFSPNNAEPGMFL